MEESDLTACQVLCLDRPVQPLHVPHAHGGGPTIQQHVAFNLHHHAAALWIIHHLLGVHHVDQLWAACRQTLHFRMGTL